MLPAGAFKGIKASFLRLIKFKRGTFTYLNHGSSAFSAPPDLPEAGNSGNSGNDNVLEFFSDAERPSIYSLHWTSGAKAKIATYSVENNAV